MAIRSPNEIDFLQKEFKTATNNFASLRRSTLRKLVSECSFVVDVDRVTLEQSQSRSFNLDFPLRNSLVSSKSNSDDLEQLKSCEKVHAERAWEKRFVRIKLDEWTIILLSFRILAYLFVSFWWVSIFKARKLDAFATISLFNSTCREG